MDTNDKALISALAIDHIKKGGNAEDMYKKARMYYSINDTDAAKFASAVADKVANLYFEM